MKKMIYYVLIVFLLVGCESSTSTTITNVTPQEKPEKRRVIKTYEEFTENRSFVNNSDIDFIKKEIQRK